jgi:hypothetical protein
LIYTDKKYTIIYIKKYMIFKYELHTKASDQKRKETPY